MRTAFYAAFQKLWVFVGPLTVFRAKPKASCGLKGHCSVLQAQPGVCYPDMHFFI